MTQQASKPARGSIKESVRAALKAYGWQKAKRRAALLLLVAAGLTLFASFEHLHAWLIEILAWAEPIIHTRPILGGAIFILFAAASAMLAFVSSAIIIPIGIYVWGEPLSTLLLWSGWIVGGACSYGIGRSLGRPVVKALSSGAALEKYEHLVSQQAPFALVVLFQLALPSEVPGYLLGLVRYPFWKYLAALALGELPYAFATVYLGSSFLERRVYRLAGMALVMVAFSAWATYELHKRLPARPPQ